MNLNTKNSLLFDAIQQNNIHDVNLYLHQGADINARWWLHNLTPLMLAIIKKRFEIACIIIQKGADLNLQSSHGNTALHYAVSNENKILINLLLEKGINKKLQNNCGQTPYTLMMHIEKWKELNFTRVPYIL